MLDTPLNSAELDLLQSIFDKYLPAEDDRLNNEISSLSELDGFLTAVVSGPRLILPSKWLPAIWGENGSPVWDSADEAGRFMELAMRHMNSIANTLMTRPEDLEPVFLAAEYEAEGETRELLLANDWCYGYLKGVQLGLWPALPRDKEEWLMAITLLGHGDHGEVLSEMSVEDYDLLTKAVGVAACNLHQYWLERRAPEMDLPGGSRILSSATPFRKQPRPGRNEPCYCGSGKKYKKCCLH